MSGRRKTAFEALLDGLGNKAGIDELVGNWGKSRRILISGEGPPGSRSQEQLDFASLQYGIGDVTYHARLILEKIAKRNPHCRDFTFRDTIDSIEVSAPALRADILIVPSEIGAAFTFTARYESVQNGRKERTEPQPLSEVELWNLLDRLAVFVLNHAPPEEERPLSGEPTVLRLVAPPQFPKVKQAPREAP